MSGVDVTNERVIRHQSVHRVDIFSDRPPVAASLHLAEQHVGIDDAALHRLR